MKNKFRMIALTAALLASIAAGGCSNNESVSTVSDMPEGEVSYPIETEETLTCWVRMPAQISTLYRNYEETPFAKELEKRTGIKVKYSHPTEGQQDEQLNLLIASGEMPDIVVSDWLTRTPEAAIQDNTIIKLNDYVNKYAPNLKKYLDENNDIDRSVKTDSGAYYAFPFIRSTPKLCSVAGMMIRKDWLDELGLDMPETIPEWENVLEQFKTKKGAAAPLLLGYDELVYMATGFDTTYEFYVDDGKVFYGPCEENYKEFLDKMHQWYDKGYIDVSFALLDYDFKVQNILNGYGGATWGSGGSGMGEFLNSAKKSGNDKYDLAAAPYPTSEKGKLPKFGYTQWPYSNVGASAVSGNCKNPALAVRWLDYSFSEDGTMFNNFGIEGESYNMIDGYPTYSDKITNNPEGLSIAQTLASYTRASIDASFIQDERYIMQYYQTQQQRDALEVWSKTDHTKHLMPQITLTKEENTEFNSIMTDIKTFCKESGVGFISGTKSIDEFESYKAQLENLGIKRAIEIYQTAYERFINR